MTAASNKSDIYDDYMEPLSGIKRQYQRFEMTVQKYDSEHRNNMEISEMCGGVPVLRDEENNSVYVDSQDTHTLVLGATGSKKHGLL